MVLNCPPHTLHDRSNDDNAADDNAPMLTPVPINDDVTDADGAYEINDARDDHDT